MDGSCVLVIRVCCMHCNGFWSGSFDEVVMAVYSGCIKSFNLRDL